MKQRKHDAQLGDRARDRITGFEGVITGRCVYITGCDQLLLAPPVKEAGDFQAPRWFDIDRCEIVTRRAILIEDVTDAQKRRAGADLPAPVK